VLGSAVKFRYEICPKMTIVSALFRALSGSIISGQIGGSARRYTLSRPFELACLFVLSTITGVHGDMSRATVAAGGRRYQLGSFSQEAEHEQDIPFRYCRRAVLRHRVKRTGISAACGSLPS
jgi:hypothetical protein